MNNVLLIYELVPDNVMVALITCDQETLTRLMSIQNTYVNDTELTDEQHRVHDEISERLATGGDWHAKLLRRDEVTIVPSVVIIRAGFIL